MKRTITIDTRGYDRTKPWDYGRKRGHPAGPSTKGDLTREAVAIAFDMKRWYLQKGGRRYGVNAVIAKGTIDYLRRKGWRIAPGGGKGTLHNAVFIALKNGRASANARSP